MSDLDAPPLRIGSLFSGYGGLDLGVQQVLGGEVAWHCDFDTGPSKVLAHHWPHVPNLHDVTTVDWAAVEPVDVITGGSPCQDVSAAGRRLGMRAGTRSGLWASMTDAIDIIRPGLVVWENVRGALSAAADSNVEPCPICVGDDGDVHLRALGRVLGDLAELGYDASWVGLRAADAGAPHARFRVFVTAWPSAVDADGGGQRRVARGGATGTRERGSGQRPADAGRAPEDPDGAARRERGDAAPRQEEAGRARPDPGGRGRALPSADPAGPGLEGDRADGRDGHGPAALGAAPAPANADGRGAQRRRGPGAVGSPPPAGAGDGRERERDGDAPGDRRSAATYPEGVGRGEGRPEPAGLVRGPDPALGGPPAGWGPYGPAVARWERVTGRPAPSPTGLSRTGAPRLAAPFVEWLMGLPAGHVTAVPGLSRNEQLKLLGNGVVPQQAALALRSMGWGS